MLNSQKSLFLKNAHSVCVFKLLLLFLFATFQSGCNNKKANPEYMIGFSQCVGSDFWRKTMLEEMKTELSLHPYAKLIYTDAAGNSKTQARQVKTMLDQGIDLLIISPNEAQPLTAIVEQTFNKGIPVIIIDRKTSSELYTAYVGANNYQIGKMAGQYIGAVLKGKGNVIEVMGLPGSSPAIERQRGFAEGLKKFSGIHIASQVYGDWLKSHAEKQLLKIKADIPKADAIFAHNDVMANGAKAVADGLRPGNKLKIVGIDALPGNGGGLQMVANKELYASLLYPTGGKEAIVTAFRILNKEPFLKENILQSIVIDSSNVQLMKLQWSKVSSQQKDIERQQVLLEEQKTVYNNQQVLLNIMVVTLVLAVVFGGLASYSLLENRKINKNLEAKNNEILNQRNQLMEMSAKVEVATEAKFNFFTNISHEFRTPLTLILSPLGDLMQNDKIRIAASGNLRLIHKNVFRLLRLVNQLIDYRKIEYDKQQVNTSPNNLVDFIKDILECFDHNANKRNIDLRLVSNERYIKLWFDPNMLDKVIFNLISNALKFTSNNGKILVSIKKEGQKVYVDVEDNGIGMNQDQASHVFDHFYQGDASSAIGSGLGLALSREIMLLHRGTIEVASQKWKGTTFTITLLTGEEHFTADEKSNDEMAKFELHERAKIYTTDLDDPEPVKEVDALRMQKEQSVLIIEDNIDLLHYLKDKFSEHYQVFIADNGTNGITLAYEQVPDLIISDIVIPNLSGNELTNKIKSDIRTSHIPIVLLTAKGSIEQQITGIESMADAYIVKPFNYDYLLATVKNLIKNRYILKEHYISDISATNKPPVSKALDKKFINDFAGIVEQNIANEKFNVDDVAKAIGISRVQLYRKVKALMDCSITDYILNRRLKKAKYLLINENYSISEITYLVGFSTPNYFATVFKSKYGCTPSDFKRGQYS